ncbi:phage baseplate assembly protein V [Salinicola aestuarinus]|uniref:phage baseplate assembly protein V n=1 Tax=Salinicola aestuarinus TaxID=1949082 RepID=UPI000DA1F685|nr:phage baseplate assembly protein V [Salinicola aestuarinus]
MNAELARLLQNLIRIGTVAEIDHAAARIRVRTGDLLTDWIPWLVDRAGQTRTWNPPTTGEQVVLVSPGGEMRAAIALPAVYANASPAPANDPNLTHWLMPDGAVIEYDHESHHLAATLPGSATLDAQGDVTVTTAAALTATATGGATINANVVINGNVTLNGNLSQPSGKSATIAGDVKFTGAVTSNGKNISASHTHDDVQRGNQTSGEVS